MKFKILWNKDPDMMKKKKCLGMCHYNSQEIWIAGDLSEETKRHVFLHEIYHVIWYAYGLNPRLERKTLEEDIVSFMAPAFLQVMDENPKAKDYLFNA